MVMEMVTALQTPMVKLPKLTKRTVTTALVQTPISANNAYHIHSSTMTANANVSLTGTAMLAAQCTVEHAITSVMYVLVQSPLIASLASIMRTMIVAHVNVTWIGRIITVINTLVFVTMSAMVALGTQLLTA